MALSGIEAGGRRTIFPSVFLLLVLMFTYDQAPAETAATTVEGYLQTSRAAGKTANRLINEVSPYLLQHAYNPVQWYAWGDEAFERAKKENKPIFLSIGYSTCHWCHVMAHESFENKEIASILNQHYISIKLDREERPDIDAVYMSATRLLNGHGGWPMTVFINHDLEPFHAGTYYPPVSSEGRRGLKELLLDIHGLWQSERDRIENVADNITVMIKRAADEAVSAESLDKNINKRVLEQLRVSFDEDYGGFGSAPKFPAHGIHAFLLRQAGLAGKDGKLARIMLSKTLAAMAQGGIFDQVGGGFHRYSVDAEWQVPHFEKMLYSQALLAIAYTRMYQLADDSLYKQVAQSTLDFVLREMLSKQGGFYSALDADSQRPQQQGERAEGAYYLWGEKELKQLLTAEEFEFAKHYYAVDQGGNILSDPQNEFSGLNILHVSEAYRSSPLAGKQQALLDKVNAKLLVQRQLRPRPHLDDKIITAWNGMMITALVEAFEAYGETKYLTAATKAAVFIRQNLVDANSGKLLRRYRNQQAGIDAGLDDYAWYIRGLTGLYRATEDRSWLKLALDLSDRQDALFLDETNGGYFDASGEDVSLLFRSRSIYDGALPAANSIVLSNLHELFSLTGRDHFEKNAYRLLITFAGAANQNPTGAAMFLSVVPE